MILDQLFSHVFIGVYLRLVHILFLCMYFTFCEKFCIQKLQVHLFLRQNRSLLRPASYKPISNVGFCCKKYQISFVRHADRQVTDAVEKNVSGLLQCFSPIAANQRERNGKRTVSILQLLSNAVPRWETFLTTKSGDETSTIIWQQTGSRPRHREGVSKSGGWLGQNKFCRFGKHCMSIFYFKMEGKPQRGAQKGLLTFNVSGASKSWFARLWFSEVNWVWVEEVE